MDNLAEVGRLRGKRSDRVVRLGLAGHTEGEALLGEVASVVI